MIHLVSPKTLRSLGIVGMNQRNISFIGKNNQRKNYRLVDDKLLTKQIAIDKGGIPVPELYGVVSYLFEIESFLKKIRHRQSFVIKPVQGSGGKGILVVTGRDGDKYIKSSGARIDDSDIRHHITNTLAGLYSLGGRTDKAMVEGLIDFDPALKAYSYEGVPDIRVIVFQGVPLMAMMRCATHKSDGKANLHQGAVGVGLDIATGKSVCAVQNGVVVTEHPDTGAVLTTLQVPDWDKILELAASCNAMTGLGYIGADVVLDRQFGPMLLELNARPGLAIQVANQAGLRHRMVIAQAIVASTDDPAERISLAKQRFGALVAAATTTSFG
ncbi:putative alpha-L-glutamate ligase [gamma proteobacterium NOR5-3]|nr:putative alpha-L-glutamate ligase [gamma proteobacterium NOR5-3]